MTREGESDAIASEHEPWIEELLGEIEDKVNGESTVVLPRRAESPALAPVPVERDAVVPAGDGFTVVMPRALLAPPRALPSESGTIVVPRASLGGAVTPTDDVGGAVTRVGTIEPWYGHAARSEGEPSRPKALARAWVGRLRDLNPRQRIMLILAPFAVPAALVITSPRKAPAPPAEREQSAAATRAVPPSARAVSKAPDAAPVRAPAKPVGSASPMLAKRAADAVAAGNEGAALELYRELAAAEPSVEAYSAAREILERRARQSAR